MSEYTKLAPRKVLSNVAEDRPIEYVAGVEFAMKNALENLPEIIIVGHLLETKRACVVEVFGKLLR
jgi:hypothetical protein